MKTVLLVDDTEVIRVVVAAFLRRYACTVIEAVNGRLGLEKAREIKPDLILLDVEMPEMDGIEVLRNLRDDPETRAIPVIMLTAQSAKEVVMQAARHGVLAYIVKPVNRQLFDKEVGKILGAVAAPATASEPAPATAEAAAPPQVSAMVVDDSQRVIDAVRTPLATRGPVIVATSGFAALERFQQDHPRIVILDLTLPDMDAFDLLIAMRQVDDGTARFLALTVRGEPEQAARALRAGFCAVIEKPVQAADLLEKVSSAVGDQVEDVWIEWVNDIPVLVFPAADATAFPRFTLAVGGIVRDIVDDGADRLVIDLSGVVDLTPAMARVLLRLVDEVRTRGLRAALCAPDEKIVHQLGEINETRGLLCAPSRPEAMAALGPDAGEASPPPAMGPAPSEPPQPKAAAVQS
ncbi:MAG TPA: response regulator, partial [Candidatus Binatia bacterium]|nr:response regulator [Candidatus Binatia bacterium]